VYVLVCVCVSMCIYVYVLVCICVTSQGLYLRCLLLDFIYIGVYVGLIGVCHIEEVGLIVFFIYVYMCICGFNR
jgi:hypothetical protein